MPTPQQKPTKAMAVRREHQDIAAGILAALSARDREVLMRFYCHGQAAERIQADMGVTETEFRLIKSRAKAGFAARVQQRIEPRAVTRSRGAKRA
jgi:DNA-directed RNA polymerase specialized sigma24 family protein